MGIWPFKRKKFDSEATAEAIAQAIAVASKKWIEFQKLPFKDEALLVDRITVFYVPFAQGLSEWKSLKGAQDSLLLMIVALGIECSETHSREEIEQALGVQMPENPFKRA